MDGRELKFKSYAICRMAPLQMTLNDPDLDFKIAIFFNVR